MPSTRYHYLDAARGVLMIVGIAFHAARVYGDTDWIVKDDSTSPIFDYLASFLTSFRMPCFFLIAGFFAALTLRRYGTGVFMQKRTPRILVPLLVTLFTLNVAQLYAVYVYDGGQKPLTTYLFSQALWQDFLSERWISHLWFLFCLAWYFGVLALASALLDAFKFRRSLAEGVNRAATLAGRPLVYLPVLPFASVAVLAVFHAFPVLYTIRAPNSLHEIASHVPFFLVGLIVYANERLYESMTRFNPRVVWLTIVVVAADLFAPVQDSLGGRVVATYVGALWVWVAIYWVLVFFRHVLNRPSALVLSLSNSSYTIYLFHHLTVILIAWWLTTWHFSIFLKYPLLVVATFASTFGLHQLVIAKVPLLSFLYNGRVPARGQSVESL